MALHRWTAQALALRTSCLKPSKSIHASQAAGVLCGLNTTIRTVHGDAYPFEVSERAIESYSGVGAILCEPGHATWKDAPWVLFAYGDLSVFLAQRLHNGRTKVLPFVWRLATGDLARYGFPKGAKLVVRKTRTHPRARFTARWTYANMSKATELSLLGAHGQYPDACKALQADLRASAQTIVDALGDTQPFLSNTTRGLTGNGAMCAPFQALDLGNATDIVLRAKTLMDSAWALGVRRVNVPMAVLGLDRTAAWPPLEAYDANGLPMPDAARRLLAHLQSTHDGIPSTALVQTMLHSSDTVKPAAHLHFGEVPNPNLTAHALLAVLKDIPA